MELRQIRSFRSIAETLHFGRMAEMIHLSQPALSLQSRALEDEIGARFFERNRRCAMPFRESHNKSLPNQQHVLDLVVGKAQNDECRHQRPPNVVL